MKKRSHKFNYSEVVVADPVYGTQKNRAYLKNKGIRYAGKALGRPKKVTEQNREQLKRDKIQAKTPRTSEAWVNSIFFVMNLLVLLRHFFVPEILQLCINTSVACWLRKTKNTIRCFTLPFKLIMVSHLKSKLQVFE